MPHSSARTIGRLSLYRRLLTGLLERGVKSVYSHEVAALAGGTAAQVRRDLMAVGYSGSPTRGYDVNELIGSIGRLLDAPDGENVAIVGVGNLGRALMAYFSGRRPRLTIAAAFDNDPHKTGRVIHGCRCFAMSELDRVIRERGIRVGIITVPAAEAQGVADRLVRAGARGLLNFAPAPISVPANVFVEDMDVTMSLEKVAFFARQNSVQKDM